MWLKKMHEWDKCNLYLVYFSLYSFITCPTEEKRPKVKKPKFEFPVYEPDRKSVV